MHTGIYKLQSPSEPLRPLCNRAWATPILGILGTGCDISAHMLFRTLLALVVATRVAGATPLEPLWQTKAACDVIDAVELIPWGDSLAWLDRGKLHRVDRATGKLGKAVKLGKLPKPASPPTDRRGAKPWLLAVISDALIVERDGLFAVFDAKGKLLWRSQSATKRVGRALEVGGDVVRVYDTSSGAKVERLAVATGVPQWSVGTEPSKSELLWADTDGKRIYVLTMALDRNTSERVLAALDAANGKQLWSQRIPLGSKGDLLLYPELALAGSTLVYSPGGTQLLLLEGATGVTRSISLPSFRSEGTLVASSTHAYMVTDTALVAVDVAQRKVQWTHSGTTNELFVATPAALYVDDELHVVRALDLKTGGELATYGMAAMTNVFAAADPRAPALVMCDRNKRLVAFDPTGPVQAPERATVTGTLSCTNCWKSRRRYFDPTTVSIGQATTTTDKRGKFKLEITARGTHDLVFGVPEIDLPNAWSGDIYGSIVPLSGKKHYNLGSIQAAISSPTPDDERETLDEILERLHENAEADEDSEREEPE